MNVVLETILGDVHETIRGDVHETILGDVHETILGDVHETSLVFFMRLFCIIISETVSVNN